MKNNFSITKKHLILSTITFFVIAIPLSFGLGFGLTIRSNEEALEIGFSHLDYFLNERTSNGGKRIIDTLYYQYKDPTDLDNNGNATTKIQQFNQNEDFSAFIYTKTTDGPILDVQVFPPFNVFDGINPEYSRDISLSLITHTSIPYNNVVTKKGINNYEIKYYFGLSTGSGSLTPWAINTNEYILLYVYGKNNVYCPEQKITLIDNSTNQNTYPNN